MGCVSVVYLGDFNVWMNDEENIRGREFLDVIDMHNLVNSVSHPTHRSGNILDSIITQKKLNSIQKCNCTAKSVQFLTIRLFNLMFMQMLPQSNWRLSVFSRIFLSTFASTFPRNMLLSFYPFDKK